MNYNDLLQQLIKNALAEDIGDGDHSTLASIDKDARGKAVLKIKEDGILAGVIVAEKIFRYMQPNIIFTPYKKDGETMQYGEIAFEVEANVHTILQTERLVLNTMQRMSGIATLTRLYVNKLKGFKTKLLDTRKTTPNFRLLEKEAVLIGGGVNHRFGLYDMIMLKDIRLLEKEAVLIGGGVNHRFGLYDMIMLKDNHIDYCGGIESAINKAYKYVQTIKPGLKIEVETRNIEDVKKVMAVGKVDRIMLDNFTPALIEDAIQIIAGQYETEASGGINLSNIETYAATGVDFISSGAVIHQARSLDLSLKAVSI